MLAHAWSLLVMPNNLVWTELMISKSIWQQMVLESVGALKSKLRCLDSIPKLTGPTQYIQGGTRYDQIFRKSTN